MALASGRLRHQMALQQQVQVQDSAGELVIDWATLATVWAAIEPASVRAFIAAGAEQSNVIGQVVMRYRAGVNASMRLVHMVDGAAGKIYNIEGVLSDKDSGQEYLTLPVSEGVNQGQ